MTSRIIPLFFCILCLVFSSCVNRQGNKGNKENPKVVENRVEPAEPVKQQNTFEPDSTINKVLALNNVRSSREFYPEILNSKLTDSLRESPVLVFYNKSQSQYLLGYQYEGGTRNAFGCFEIGYADSIKSGKLVLNYEQFKTESGLKLGLSFEDLVKIKGTSYTKEGDIIIYNLDDYQKSAFLKRHNMPAYFLECTLNKDRIVKIKFGFDYP